MSFFAELKRRNVFRVGVAYAVVAWLVLQVTDVVLNNVEAPGWVFQVILLVLGIGFLMALVFAWAFELTPEGIKREKDVDRSQSITTQTGRRLDRTIIVVLALALGYFAWDKFSHRSPAPVVEQAGVEQALLGPTAEPESAMPDDKSIAVLPFENRSQREEDEYFSSGIHDDLLTQLAQIASLRVISRTSVAQFKGTTLSIREIAEKLGVATILEGGVQRAGNQVRINMQLIDAETDGHLWAQTFDRELTANNIFSIQTEIATAVTDAMRATLTPDEQQRIREVPTKNMAALELFFKGRAELDQRTVPSIESARLRFEEARRLDPGFAQAWAGEAQAILLLSEGPSSYGEIPRQEAIALARTRMEEAYRLAPDEAQVLAVYGLLERDELRIDQALDYYRRSLAINPSSGEVLNWQRMAQSAKGLHREALATTERMVEVDPLSMIALFNAAASFVNTPYDDGVRVEQLLDRLQGLEQSYGLAARALVAERRGHIVEAVRHYYRSMELDPGRSTVRAGLGAMLRDLGLVEEALLVDPRMDELDAAWARFDGDSVLRLARARFADDQTSRSARFNLMYATAIFSDQPEEAMPLARGILQDFEASLDMIWNYVLDMAWIADSAEFPAEAAQWRDSGAASLQKQIESGEGGGEIEMGKAKVALLDRRKEDALQALARAIDLGERSRFIDEHPMFSAVKDEPQFQALVSRMRATVEQERAEVVAMLCGPDKIVREHQPAPETCALYRPAAL
jgi:TolB-like protein